MSLTILGLRLTPLRILLLVLFIPYLSRVLRGKAGKISLVDWLMLFHAVWIALALMVVHGPEKIPFAGITMVELVGGYFMGRVLIRSNEDYRKMVLFHLYALILLLPFAVVELLTGRLVIPEIVGHFFETTSRYSNHYGSATGRMGLERVYAVFEHPILFGMFCSLGIANLFYFGRGKSTLRVAGMLLAVFMAFMSLSSAPLLACGLQAILMVWDKITKGAWKTILIIGVLGYITLDSLSNRTPITILIETLTFNSGTGWTRIAIFEYGIQNAIAHPIFGIGFNDWIRPYWLTSSVDNFWLLNTMRYGFVGAGFLVFAFAVHLVKTMISPISDPDTRRLRVGYVIALTATCFTLATVHVWGAVGVFIMFYLGAGGWFYNHDEAPSTPEQDVIGATSPTIRKRATQSPRQRSVPNAE